MLGRDYSDQRCSIAATLGIVGERWTILILRDAFLGVRRFDTFQKRLGIARNVLQTRLERLVDEGILRRDAYSERPPRFEYRLTEKGVDLWPVVIALLKWGDRHVMDGVAPVVIEHRDCGGEIDDRRRCTACGAELEARDVTARLGPGAPDDPAARTVLDTPDRAPA